MVIIVIDITHAADELFSKHRKRMLMDHTYVHLDPDDITPIQHILV